MPSFTRIFKHSHKDKDKDREKENRSDPVITSPTPGTTTTTHFIPAAAEPSSPDFAQAFHSNKGKKKKDKKDKTSLTSDELAQRAEKEKQRFAELKRRQTIESDAWQKTSVDPQDVVELLNAASKEIKARGNCIIHSFLVIKRTTQLTVSFSFSQLSISHFSSCHSGLLPHLQI